MLAKSIQDEFDPAGNSQFVKDPVDVVSYGMFFHLEFLGDFAVLQAIGDEMNHFFLPTCQEWHSVVIVQMDWICASQSVYKMFDVFVASPDLSLVDSPNALGESFQGMRAIKNTTRSNAKSVDHTLWPGTLQQHDGRDVMRNLQFLKDLDAGLRAVLKLFADQGHVGLVRCQPANNFLRTSRHCVDRKAISTTRERIPQQLACHIIRRDNENRDAIFGPPQRLGHSTASIAPKNMSGRGMPNEVSNR